MASKRALKRALKAADQTNKSGLLLVTRVPQSEKDLSRTVTDLLTLRGWLWQHQRPAQTTKGWRTAISGAVGFPDIIAVRNGSVIVIELKSEQGKTSPEQLAWIAALRKAGIPAYIWRPSDWVHIEEVLL